MMDWQRVTNFDKSAENYFGRILLPGRAGGVAAVRYDGEGGDKGERRAVCGAGIKTPEKFSKRAGSLAGSQRGVALCRRCKSWSGAEGRDSAGKLTGIIPLKVGQAAPGRPFRPRGITP